MINPFREINWRPDVRARRQFAKTLIVGFPCLAVALLVFGALRGAGWNTATPVAVGSAGTAVGILLWLLPAMARPVYLIWHLVGAAIGFVTGNLILLLVYLLLVVPIGVTLRAFGRGAVTKRFDRARQSYWVDAKPPGAPASYFRQF